MMLYPDMFYERVKKEGKERGEGGGDDLMFHRHKIKSDAQPANKNVGV